MEVTNRIHAVPLDQQPCFVHLLEHHDRYLIGTYHLYPTIESYAGEHNSKMDLNEVKQLLDKINNRGGKLVILQSNFDPKSTCTLIEHEYECSNGGVFDAKVRYNKLDCSYDVFTAHSNGVIGVYRLTINDNVPNISLKEQYVVPHAKILTSIDIFPDGLATIEACDDGFVTSTGSDGNSKSANSPGTRMVVGDDTGFVTVICRGNDVVREDVGSGDPVWQVKSLRLSLRRDIVIVASEKNAWYIYEIDDKTKELIKVYGSSQNDFQSGVTSIALLSITPCEEHDAVEVLFGSYDETIKTYTVKLYRNKISPPSVQRKVSLSIQGGGIWRVKQCNPTNKREICVAAMYAGSCTLILDDEQQGQSIPPEKTITKLIDSEKLGIELAKEPLHYDIGMSACKQTFCIADFNNSMCLVKPRLIQ